MCLAAATFANSKHRFTRGEMEMAADNNPDGFGYSFCHPANPHEVVIRRATRYNDLADTFWGEYEEHGERSAFLVHFRLATSGGINVRNTHPFRIKGGGALIHNGVISCLVGHGDSDTAAFARDYIGRLPRGWEDDEIWRDFVDEYIGYGNKIATLRPDGYVTIIGQRRGGAYWRDGTWYSNDSAHKAAYVALPHSGTAATREDWIEELAARGYEYEQETAASKEGLTTEEYLIAAAGFSADMLGLLEEHEIDALFDAYCAGEYTDASDPQQMAIVQEIWTDAALAHAHALLGDEEYEDDDGWEGPTHRLSAVDRA